MQLNEKQFSKPNFRNNQIKSLGEKLGTGVQAHLGNNYKWWCQKRNIGDPQGCLGGKYKKSFLALKKRKRKKYGNSCAQDLKIQGKILFLFFFYKDRNVPKREEVVK